MIKNLIFPVLMMVASCSTVFSQSKYSGKVEVSYLSFGFRTLTIDQAPDFKGYNLANEQDGVGINLISGFTFQDKLFAGVGLGYLNFDLNYEGINGIMVFSDLEYIVPTIKNINPLLNARIGYSKIWNRHEKGTGTALVELGAGLIYLLTEKTSIDLHSGVLFTQQSAFLPIRIGLHYYLRKHE